MLVGGFLDELLDEEDFFDADLATVTPRSFQVRSVRAGTTRAARAALTNPHARERAEKIQV